jgi:Protein of unknown function (DUF3108)
MKSKLLFVILMLSGRLPVSVNEDPCVIKNLSFYSGEKVRYNIYYYLAGVYVEAGEVRFSCAMEQFGQKPVYHVIATGKTLPFYDHLYKVREFYESFMDTSTLLAYKFVRNIQEGSTRKYENIIFNRKVQTAITDSGVYKISPCVQDVLGAVYYIRNIPTENLKPGDKVGFTMFLDNRLYPSYIRYMGKEIIKTKYGRFHTIKIKPLLIEGSMFEAGEKMTVWVTDDQNHLPVRIQSLIRIGSVKADMMEFENLRWPLSALINK